MLRPTENGLTIWFTGLSGSGKSTISNHLKELLSDQRKIKILDGDVVRNGLNSDLAFSDKDRKENIRRIAHVAKLFNESGYIVLVALISPFKEMRKLARDIHDKNNLKFIEVFVNSPLHICERRDVKGLYKLARDGKIREFTGIDSPYEVPTKPDLEINTSLYSIDASVEKILDFISLELTANKKKKKKKKNRNKNDEDKEVEKEEKISDEKISEEKISDEKISEEKISYENESEEKISDEKISYENESDEEISYEKESDEKMESDEKESDEKMNDDKELKEDVEKFQLFMNDKEIQEHTAKAAKYESIDIDKVDLQWVQVLSEGWAMPLKGFMREKEYLQTLHFNTIQFKDKLHSFSLPIVLDVPKDKMKAFLKDHPLIIALKYNNRLVAILTQWQIYPHNKVERCCRQFGIYSERHPSIKMIANKSDWLIGGDLKVVGRINWDDGLDLYRLTPAELRKAAKTMNADAIYAFQLRNPVHNGHVLLMNETRKMLIKKGYKNPVLLLHPLGGWTKDDDVPLPTRIKQHLAVMEDGLLDPKTTLLAIFPSPMVYAGPTEVQWHCRCRIVAGANFYIVGRDPAGLPNPNNKDLDLYDPTHGSKVIRLASALKDIQIIPFVVAAYNKETKSMEIFDPAKKENFVFISGTKMRSMARDGIEPPEGFMSPTGWKIMKSHYQAI